MLVPPKQLHHPFRVTFANNEEFERPRFDMFVDGVRATRLPRAAGIRGKFEFNVEGRRYFAKVGWQSEDEVRYMQRIEPADYNFFIPLVQYGSIRDYGREFVIQEYIEFLSTTDKAILKSAWDKIHAIGEKYGILKDLLYDEGVLEIKNWGIVAATGQPVVYDVGYV
jgi:hypothetical protein